MRKKLSSAFTLIETITTMAIIVILAGIVVGLAGYVTKKSNLTRAQGEMSMLKAALENYKAETGGYPQEVIGDDGEGVTDLLSPKRHFIPTSTEYSNSSQYLYKQLTGDKTGTSNQPDGVPDDGEPSYLKQYDKNRILAVDKNSSTGAIIKVKGFQDPFGYYYGYSTAAARTERVFQSDFKKGNATSRKTGDDMPGYNTASYDLWCTAGSKPTTNPSSPALKERETAKWEKNW
jgi:prepilin-type N-terminal cleavage/methylation domain-containing protein